MRIIAVLLLISQICFAKENFIKGIEASSVYKCGNPKTDPNFYGPEKLFDGNWLTCWQANAGGGEWVQINFTRPVNVGAIAIVDRANSGLDWISPRSNVSNIDIEFSEGTKKNYTFPVSADFKTYSQDGFIFDNIDPDIVPSEKNTRGAQYLRFEPITTDSIKISVKGMVNPALRASLGEIRIIEVPQNDRQPLADFNSYQKFIKENGYKTALPDKDWQLKNAAFNVIISNKNGNIEKLESLLPKTKSVSTSQKIYVRNIERNWKDYFSKLIGYKIEEKKINNCNVTEFSCLLVPETYNVGFVEVRYTLSEEIFEQTFNFQFYIDDWCRYRIGFNSDIDKVIWPVHRDCGDWTKTDIAYTRIFGHSYDTCWEQGDWTAQSIPMDVIDSNDRYLVYGSFDLGSNMVFAPNAEEKNTLPSIFVMPWGVKSGQSFKFNTFYKTLDKAENGYMEVFRWYCQNTFLNDPELKGIDVRLTQKIPRTLPPGRIVPGHTPTYDVPLDGGRYKEGDEHEKLKLCEERMRRVGMSNIWYAEWDIWVHSQSEGNENYPLANESAWRGYRRDNFTVADIKADIKHLQSIGQNIYLYLNQCISVPGGCQILEGAHRFDADDPVQRRWYIDRVKEYVKTFEPNGICWDAGWWAMHYAPPNFSLSGNPKGGQDLGWLKIQAQLYTWLKANYPNMHVIINHEGGGAPTQWFTDAVIVEGPGISHGPTVEDAKALMNALGSYFNVEAYVDKALEKAGLTWEQVVKDGLPESAQNELWKLYITPHMKSLALGCGMGGHPMTLVEQPAQRRSTQPTYMAKTAVYLPLMDDIVELGQFSAKALATPLICHTKAIKVSEPNFIAGGWCSEKRLMSAVYNDSGKESKFEISLSKDLLEKNYLFKKLGKNIVSYVINENGLREVDLELNLEQTNKEILISGNLKPGQMGLIIVE